MDDQRHTTAVISVSTRCFILSHHELCPVYISCRGGYCSAASGRYITSQKSSLHKNEQKPRPIFIKHGYAINNRIQEFLEIAFLAAMDPTCTFTGAQAEKKMAFCPP